MVKVLGWFEVPGWLNVSGWFELPDLLEVPGWLEDSVSVAVSLPSVWLIFDLPSSCLPF